MDPVVWRKASPGSMLSCLVLLATGIAVCGTTNAADAGARAGHGHMSLAYQYISVDGFESSIGKLPIGDVETHSWFLEVEYAFTERLTVVAGIPYVRKRYRGGGPHDPLLLDPPRPQVENVDQGDWNSDFQDFHFGVRYLAMDGPIIVEPYVAFGVPSHEYAFFGHAAVGQHLLKFDVGTSVTWLPGLSNAYYRADLAYVFVEEAFDVSINHWRLNAEVGYQFGPRLTGRAFMQLKNGGGMTFPDNFPPPRNDEQWYQHDRLVKHNYMNMGIGADWVVNDKYVLGANILTMTWAEQVHTVEYAISVGLSRSF